MDSRSLDGSARSVQTGRKALPDSRHGRHSVTKNFFTQRLRE